MSIQSDDNSTGLTEEAAEAALFESLGGDPANSNDVDQDDDDADQGDDSDLDEGDNDGAEEQPDLDEDDQGANDDDEAEEAPEDNDDAEADAPPTLNDDAEIEVTVNGETSKVTLGSLKRLAGQEASLTRKSQEAELVGGRAAAALQAAIAMAQEDLQPYANVDWLVLQAEMDPEDFAWHRQNAQRVQTRFQNLIGAAQGVEQSFADRRKNIDRDAAAAAVQELKADIPEWSEKVYSDILAYGETQGLEADDLASITNPKIIKLLRKAMLHDRGQQVATRKVREAPTKVLRGNARTENAGKAAQAKKAQQRFARTGSDDDAVAVLMGRWG